MRHLGSTLYAERVKQYQKFKGLLDDDSDTGMDWKITQQGWFNEHAHRKLSAANENLGRRFVLSVEHL